MKQDGTAKFLPNALRQTLLSQSDLHTPLSNMNSFSKLVRAYWMSDRWKEAWATTAAIGCMIAASSQSHVWMAQSAGTLIDNLSKLSQFGSGVTLSDVGHAGGWILGIALAQHLAILPGNKFLLENLHRKWRGWLNEQFNHAILDDKHTYMHLNHANGAKDDKPGYPAMPRNIDQRWQESVKAMTGSTLGLAYGALGVVSSFFFVTKALLEHTAPVKGLEMFGEYGTLALTFGAAAAFVPANTYIAWKLGKYLERVTNRIEETEGTYRGELNALMRLGLHIAASGASHIHAKVNRKLYQDVDAAWKDQITAHTIYSSFNGLYSSVANRIVAYLPGLPAYAQGSTGFGTYVTGAELFTSFIGQCSWLINVMPGIAGLKAHYRRVAEVIDAVERVSDPQTFYQQSGVSNYRFDTQNPAFGMRVRNLVLRHEGHGSEPFLQAANLRFRPGQWTYLQGASGCGKTSMLHAMNGLLPYGEGQIIMPEGARKFYAAQEVRLPRVSLKQLVAIPDDESRHDTAQVRMVLRKAGLGEFSDDLDSEARQGKYWEDVFSGGQKQKLVLARILLQQPDVIFLDEATSALDPQSKITYHELIKKYCPEAIVVSVMHDPAPPVSRNGKPFYDSVMRFENGHASIHLAYQQTARRQIAAPAVYEPSI